MSPVRPGVSRADGEPGGSRRRGRPQDPALDAAIRAAAVQVLTEVGYRGLTMDAVAMVAGVSKATIYRRWPSKAELLVSVIDAASDLSLLSVDTGSLRDDLVAHLSSLVDVLRGPGGGVSRALFGALQDEPALAEAYRRGPFARWAGAFSGAFLRAAARGEVPPEAGTTLAAEAGPGILLRRWLVGAEIDDALVVAIVDDVMMPLLRAGAGSWDRGCQPPPG